MLRASRVRFVDARKYTDEEEGAEEDAGEEGAEEAGDEGAAEEGDEEGPAAEEEPAAEAEPRAEEVPAVEEEPAAEGPAAEKAGMQMLAANVKAHRSIQDPAEWLQSKVKAGVESTVKHLLGGSSVHKGHSRVPDPMEWVEERYLKHKHGAKTLARKPSAGKTGSPHMITPKMSSAKTPQLFQLRKDPSYGNFQLASEGSAKMARQQASLLGCEGTHYRRFGTTKTYTVAPCKNDADEFKGLATNRFARHNDVGTTVDGAFTDYKAIQFQHQYYHHDLASASDDDFLMSSSKLAGAAVNPFGSKADAADDDILQSSAQAQMAHTHPDAMAGMTSARHGPASWHTW